ncbi:MAG: type II toxin-antitoxin system YafO family toxin [Cytophagales bacterium]|nr:type II toxin-antitoxin system YafO family toxin [Cytophagales bacterium]
MSIRVQTTKALERAFASDPALSIGLSPFCAAFQAWKESGAVGEYDHYLFGKDAAYITPSVNDDPYTLRHVHIVPFADIEALKRWDKAFDRKRRKVSNRALIYVEDERLGCLLLFILPEPEAHEVAKMQTPQDRALMLGLAKVAGEFLVNGRIVA